MAVRGATRSKSSPAARLAAAAGSEISAGLEGVGLKSPGASGAVGASVVELCADERGAKEARTKRAMDSSMK